MLQFDGLNEAVIGIFPDTVTQKDRIVYSANKIIEIFQERDGMTYDGAREMVDYNYLGAHLGDETPVIVVDCDYETAIEIYGEKDA